MSCMTSNFDEMMAISAFNDALKTAFYNKEPLHLDFKWLAPRAKFLIKALSEELKRQMSPAESQLVVGTRVLIDQLNKALESEDLRIELNPIVCADNSSDW